MTYRASQGEPRNLGCAKVLTVEAYGKMKKFYVYEWYDLDSGVIFYVGKGTGNRMNNTNGRNRYFKRYIKAHNCANRKIREFDKESDALKYEKERIAELRKQEMCFCNFDEGGRNGGRCYGEWNGMYHKTHSEEVKRRLREINSDGRHKGKNNSQYGISLRERMSAETYRHWVEQHKKMTGEKNSQFKVSPKDRMSKETYAKWLKSQNKGTKGKNPNAKKIIMYNEYTTYYFNSIIECAEFLIKNKCRQNTKITSVQNNISTAIHLNKKYHSYYFKFN